MFAMHEFAAEPLNHRNVAADGLFDGFDFRGNVVFLRSGGPRFLLLQFFDSVGGALEPDNPGVDVVRRELEVLDQRADLRRQGGFLFTQGFIALLGEACLSKCAVEVSLVLPQPAQRGDGLQENVGILSVTGCFVVVVGLF
jgi:hypothetical protein